MKMGWSLGWRRPEPGGTRSTGWPPTNSAGRHGALRTASIAWVLGVALGLLAVVLLTALSACSKHKPARLPIASIYARTTARLEVTAIVVQDQQRAERAREIYTSIAELGEHLASQRKQVADQVTQLTSQPSLDLAKVEAAIEQVKRDQKAALNQYIALQMELRKTLSLREFEQLERFE